MREREPVTQTMKISDVKNTLSSLVNQVYRKETRVPVEKAGISVNVLASGVASIARPENSPGALVFHSGP